MAVVYHYTSKANLEAILNSGYIKQSYFGGVDAKYGTGVYLTTLDPHNGRKQIALNNWGPTAWKAMEERGKVECAIKLRIPSSRLQKADSDRDILLHKGKLYLAEYSYEIINLDESGCIIM